MDEYYGDSLKDKTKIPFGSTIMTYESPSDQKNFRSNNEISQVKTFENTVSRLSSFNDKKNTKLEAIRREQFISEIRSLQEKPIISENSKKLLKNHVPLYKRLDEVVKQKYEHKKHLQIQSQIKKRSEFKENCTFNPCNVLERSRTPEEFLACSQTWQSRKEQVQKMLYQEKQVKISQESTAKPTISQNSLLLSMNRSQTPVFERLYEVKSSDPSVSFTFTPSITANSKKIIKGKRNTPIFERLYSLRKLYPSTESLKKGLKQGKTLVQSKSSTNILII